MILFDHFTHVPKEWWRWRYFTPKELACRGTGELGVDEDALTKLSILRETLATPLIIHSAYRSALHNARVGGAPLSQHRRGTAFDIGIRNVDVERLREAAADVGFTGFGVGHSAFLHVDTGPRRTWRYA